METVLDGEAYTRRLLTYGIYPYSLKRGPIIEGSDYRPYVEEPFDDSISDKILSDVQFPVTTLIAVAGKPILEVIDHPVTRERYTAADVIERAFWDDEAQVSVFEVRRAA